MAETPQQIVDRELREFKRYTGDGLPGEPVNAPLPVGDPQSGNHNPKKVNLRNALKAPLEGWTEQADRAQAEANRAAGYVNDIVSEKEVPITATRNGMEALEFPNGMNVVQSRGFTAIGDGGEALYVRVASEPNHPGKVRSSDRYLPDGSVNPTNGGWWEIIGFVLSPEDFGAIGDGVTDDSDAFQACHDTLHARGGGTMSLGPKTYYLSRPCNVRSTGSYYGQSIVVNVIGEGSRTVLTRNMNSAADTPDVDDEAECYAMSALALFCSNAIIDRISFRDCGVGLYMGQDPDSDPSDLTNVSFNRITNLWARDCGVGVIGFSPLNIYYNGFQDWHITECQFGFIMDWHSGSTYDNTIANFNRNQCRNVRISRCWVGMWSKAGGTNGFIGLHCEGNAGGGSGTPTSNRYPAPSMPPEITTLPAAIILGDKSHNNTFEASMFENNDWDWYNFGYDNSFTGYITLAKCTFATPPRELITTTAKAWAEWVGGLSGRVSSVLTAPLGSPINIGGLAIPGGRLYSYGISGAEIHSTGTSLGIQQYMGDGLRHSRSMNLGVFASSEAKTGIILQSDRSGSYFSRSTGVLECILLGEGTGTNLGHVTKFSVYYHRNPSGTVTRVWLDTDSVKGGFTSGNNAGSNNERFTVSAAVGANNGTIELSVTAPARAMDRVSLFIDERMSRDSAST